MPSFLHARNSRIFWGGYDVSNMFTDYTLSSKVDDVDTTTFTSTSNPAKTFLLGFEEGDVKLSGLYDPTATSGSDALLSAGLGSSTVTNLVMYFPSSTWALGDPGIGASLREAQYDIKGNVGSAVALEAGGKADGGIDRGLTLHTDTTAITSNESPSTGVDFGSSSTGAWAAYLNATACTGTATMTVKTSPTNGTFATTLTTFTILDSVPTSEIKTGTSATAWQFAAVFSVVASSPSYRYAVLLARR